MIVFPTYVAFIKILGYGLKFQKLTVPAQSLIGVLVAINAKLPRSVEPGKNFSFQKICDAAACRKDMRKINTKIKKIFFFLQ